MGPSELTIVISPIGDLGLDGAFLAWVGTEVQKVFGFPTQVVPLLDEADLGKNWPIYSRARPSKF